MKQFLLVLMSSILIADSAFAQDGGPVVGKLGNDLAEKAKSLNPEYLVFSPRQKLNDTMPLVIYLHGAGGVGDNIQKVKGQAGQVWKGIEKFKQSPGIVVAPPGEQEGAGKRRLGPRPPEHSPGPPEKNTQGG